MIEANYQPITQTEGTLTVVAGAVDMEPAKKAAVSYLGNKQTIPGFRKGQAPASIVEKHLDKKLLIKEFLNQFVLRAVYNGWHQLKLRPIVRPDINVADFKPFESIKIEAKLSLIVDTKVPDWRQIQLPEIDNSIKPKDLNRTLQILVNRQSTWETVERPSALGDRVWFNFKTETTPYQKNQETKIVLDKDQISEKLISKFLNKSTGETIETTEKVRIDRPIFHMLGLSDQSKDNQFQEKKVIHRVSKVEACTKKASLEEIAESGKTTPEKIKGELQNQLESDTAKRNQAQIRRTVASYLSGKTEMNISPDVLKNQAESLDRQLKKRFGFDDKTNSVGAQYFTKIGVDQPEYQRLIQESVTKTARLIAALLEIGEANNINLEFLAKDLKEKPPFLAYFEQSFINSRSNHFVLNRVISFIIGELGYKQVPAVTQPQEGQVAPGTPPSSPQETDQQPVEPQPQQPPQPQPVEPEQQTPPAPQPSTVDPQQAVDQGVQQPKDLN